MRGRITSFISKWRSRAHVLDWLKDEWHQYADAKWEPERDKQREHMRTEGLSPDGWWRKMLDDQIHRAHLLGIDRPEGKQALMKAACIMNDMCAIVVDVHGDLPQPGYPSGEIH